MSFFGKNLITRLRSFRVVGQSPSVPDRDGESPRPADRAPLGDRRTRLKGRYCKEPFSFLYVGEMGKAHICCPSWLKGQYSIGNVFEENDVQKIWNSKEAKIMRRSVTDGTFSLCNDYCPHIAAKNLPKIDECDEFYGTMIQYATEDVPQLPQNVQFAYDCSCNLFCVSCRNSRYLADRQTTELFDSKIDSILKPLLRDAKRLLLSGSGELFASKHSTKLLSCLNSMELPGLRLFLQTNGQILSRAKWHEMPNVHDMVHTISVSIDAASRETYERVRRGGNWDVLQENLKFVAYLRRMQVIRELQMRFVVHVKNFWEMKSFVEWGLEVGADAVAFCRIENWNLFDGKDFVAVDVADESNIYHKDLRNILGDPVFGDKRRVWLGNLAPLRR